MNLEQALKQEYAYLKIQNFLINHSYLFSDSEFKVIMALYSMLDYQFKHTFVPVSQTELLKKTGKKRQRIYSILTNLEDKGLITKVSGKYAKELSLKLREEFFGREQKPLRSFNEKNVYNLLPLLELVIFLMQVEKILDSNTFFEFLHTAVRREGKTLMAKILANAEDFGIREEIAIYCHLKGDSNILSSDSNILQRPMQEPATNNTHTHHTHDGFEEREKQSQTSTNEQTKPLKTEVKEKREKEYRGISDKRVLNVEIDEELKEYIMADLIRQEQEGKINSANAVFKTLTEQDIQLYKQRLKAEKEKCRLEQLKILKILKTDWDKIKEKFKKARTYSNHSYVYVLLKKETAEKAYERLKDKISCELKDYTEEMKKYFLSS